MTITMDAEGLVADLRRQTARETVARITKLRDLRQLHEMNGYTQVELAKILKVSQPSISDMLRRARIEAPDVRPGTHGGTAYEIAARYAAGELDRETALRELIEWRYEPAAEPNPFPWVNDGAPVVDGSFQNQVVRAKRVGFLTREDYAFLFDAMKDD
jgi:ParB-like chromosome segregation protein Spo0J